jgi:hypothetical protein
VVDGAGCRAALAAHPRRCGAARGRWTRRPLPPAAEEVWSSGQTWELFQAKQVALDRALAAVDPMPYALNARTAGNYTAPSAARALGRRGSGDLPATRPGGDLPRRLQVPRVCGRRRWPASVIASCVFSSQCVLACIAWRRRRCRSKGSLVRTSSMRTRSIVATATPSPSESRATISPHGLTMALSPYVCLPPKRAPLRRGDVVRLRFDRTGANQSAPVVLSGRPHERCGITTRSAPRSVKRRYSSGKRIS